LYFYYWYLIDGHKDFLMPTLSRFTNQDLPDYFAHQIRDFIRIHWFDAFEYDIHAPVMPHEWQPVYFVVTEEQALYSHAAGITRSVECNGHTYTCGGLSSALTYPAFRKRGYGSQTVQAATEHLKASGFDLTMLWTDADKAGFYTRFGWQHYPSLRVNSGPKDAPHAYGAFTMIQLLSANAKAHQADFESQPIYIGEWGW
jgi:GNAT superfamily N-acetyltransferase